MTDLKGMNTRRDERLRKWLSQFDTDQFLVASHSRSDSNLLDNDAQQGLLTIGLPTNEFGGPNVYDNCMFWMPDTCPSGKSVHLASSRLGKRPDQKRAIFNALRTFAVQANHGSRFLVVHPGTTLHDYAMRLSKLFDLPTLSLVPMPRHADSDWFRQQLNQKVSNICFYSAVEGITPKADELLIGSCTELRVLSARSHGNVAKLTSDRLQLQDSSKCRTYLLADDELISTKLVKSFRQTGAIDWWLFPKCAPKRDKNSRDGSIITLSNLTSKIDANQFLIHWTRQRTGPWPDQSDNEFLDSLLLGLDANDFSRIASLCRIITSTRLLASKKLVRGDTPVVCFADISVDQLMQKRVFRSHLGRWDFEPCGIAIRKSVLKLLGAKPVIYGDDDVWSQLSNRERPLFQRSCSKSASGNTIDWTQENEYRICGDVRLNQIANDDAFLFVETNEEAQTVAPLSRWPVVVLSE